MPWVSWLLRVLAESSGPKQCESLSENRVERAPSPPLPATCHRIARSAGSPPEQIGGLFHPGDILRTRSGARALAPTAGTMLRNPASQDGCLPLALALVSRPQSQAVTSA